MVITLPTAQVVGTLSLVCGSASLGVDDQCLLNELIKSKQVSGLYAVLPLQYGHYALSLYHKLFKCVMSADSCLCSQASPCAHMGMHVHTCARVHGIFVYLCICTVYAHLHVLLL